MANKSGCLLASLSRRRASVGVRVSGFSMIKSLPARNTSIPILQCKPGGVHTTMASIFGSLSRAL